jgi:hypothetical protein
VRCTTIKVSRLTTTVKNNMCRSRPYVRAGFFKAARGSFCNEGKSDPGR